MRYDSPAQKIFLPEFRKNSLQEQTINERIAFKELILYLINTQEKSAFFRFIKEIEPLNFDIALMNNYIEELCRGYIPQDLVNEVECLYEELPSSEERLRLIDLIGDSNVMFDYATLRKCYDMLKSLVAGEYDCIEFAKDFPNELIYLEDDDVYEILKEIPQMCIRLLQQKNIDDNFKIEFVASIVKVVEDFKEFCAFKD